jgi:hypothetical protein
LEAHGQDSGGLRVSPLALIACEAALAVGWLLDYLVFRPPFPVSYGGVAPLAPLYAFPIPLFRAQAIVFVGLALLFVSASERLCDPSRVGKKMFAFLLATSALFLPLALFLVRQDFGRLGSQFEIYRADEFLDDARHIDSLSAFLAGYVERMPSLSLHGAHFPPGHAVLLYVVGKAFGFGTLPAGIAVLACFAVGVLVCWQAIGERCPGRAGRQAALLLLACPSMLDFACTSMDAVFLLFAALALRAGLRALEPGASVPSAIGAGALLLLATFFSFSALPLGLVLLLYAAFTGVHQPVKTLARLAWIGAAYAAAALSLFGATGFPIWRCLFAARRAGLELMARAAGADPRSMAPQFWYGNITAFSIGAGVALLVALTARWRVRSLCADPWTPAVLVTLAAMTFGGMYFMETERVWLFVLPWIALAAVTAGAFEARSLRLLLFAGLAQALAMEIGLFTLW